MARKRRRKQMAEMNVVPYIDVMLVLLVIFMVTAPMMQTGVQITLPDADAEAVSTNVQQHPVQIDINKEGQVYIEGEPLDSVEALIPRLASLIEEDKQRAIHIQGDREASYDAIFSAMAAAQSVGAKNIGLIASPSSSPILDE